MISFWNKPDFHEYVQSNFQMYKFCHVFDYYYYYYYYYYVLKEFQSKKLIIIIKKGTGTQTKNNDRLHQDFTILNRIKQRVI